MLRAAALTEHFEVSMFSIQKVARGGEQFPPPTDLLAFAK